MHYSQRLAILLMSVALWQSAATAGTAAMSKPEQQQLLEQMGLGQATSVSYRNETKAAITADAFFARITKGASFDIEKTADAKTVTLTLQAAAAPPPKSKLKRGAPLPPLSLTRVDGIPLDSKALAGKYTVLSFFFSTCAPCIQEVPELNALAQAHRDINLLAITHDPASEARQFIRTTGITWPVAADARSFMEAAGIRAFPTLMLLDPQGRIIDINQGYTPPGKGAGRMEAWLRRHVPGKKT